MEFEIDISGNDLLSKNYTICIANKDRLIKVFKFDDKLVKSLCSRYGQGIYKYSKSKKGKALFKIRLYCIVIFYLFKSLNLKEEISVNLCRDFSGRENDIKETLKYFLGTELKINLNERIYFGKLSQESNAHRYSFLMRHDNKNQMKTYIKLSLEDIEKWLLK